MLFAAIVALSALVWSTAAAQTTMQRQHAEQQDDEQQDDEQRDDEQRDDERATDDDRQADEDSSSSSGPSAPGEDEGYTESDWTQSHIPGLRLDFGFNPAEELSNWGLGLGYMFALNWRIRVLETELLFRGGAGPDLTFVGGTDEGFDGINMYATARGTFTGPRGGMTVKFGLGWAAYSEGFVPGAKVGLFYATEVFEAGYFFQTAYLGDFQPDWMTPHNLGLRLHIPVIEY